jgi:hypothetical protein
MEDNSEKSKDINYEQYIVKREIDDYWRGRDKVQLVIFGLTKQIPITILCKINGVSPSLYYEWREIFLKRGEEGLVGVNGRSQRELELEKKIHVLERCIGELTLEKELLKKLQE